LLGERLRRHRAQCWLVNTGWIAGPYGVGRRMSLPHTRALLNAALAGQLDDAEYTPHPIFRVAVPKCAPGVPAEILDARAQWSDPAAYDRAARDLAARFNKNFQKFPTASEEIRSAAPVV
jgi:phosphoenolpyruvate carboxykinase (ATP)